MSIRRSLGAVALTWLLPGAAIARRGLHSRTDREDHRASYGRIGARLREFWNVRVQRATRGRDDMSEGTAQRLYRCSSCRQATMSGNSRTLRVRSGTSRGFLRVASALALVLPLLSSSAAAQQGAGSIVGLVTDGSGGVLPGVTVTATSPSLQMPQVTAITDERGDYRLTPLPIGTYAVEYTLTGFQTVRREGLHHPRCGPRHQRQTQEQSQDESRHARHDALEHVHLC